MTIVQQVAAFAASVAANGVPELHHDVARRYVDLFGNSLAALDLPPAKAVTTLVEEWGGRAESTLLGTGLRVPAASAALVNGTLAHSMDFDDTHLPSVLHPSASVLPAALAVGEAVGASGAAVLDAAAVGLEVTVRLGMAGYDAVNRVNVYFDRGQHATSICGTVGSAVAAAMLYELTEDGIAHAAGIAASMGSGLLEANRTGGSVKRVHCGWAAHSGVVAARLVRHGLTGPPTVIEGRFGFLQAWLGDQANSSAVLDALGEQWEVPKIHFKPYPCNHFTHAGIDAALAMRAEGLTADRIDRMELGVAPSVLRTIAEPAESKARPESGYHAAFSGPYTVAAALLGSSGLGLSHDDFTDEAARDPRRLALAARVLCVPDEHCARIFPNQLPAVLRVWRDDGTLVQRRVDVNRGGPDNPLSDEELATKFTINAERALDTSAATKLADRTLALATMDDLSALTGSLTRRP
jgi:2-methylcitrate dehydratase PrpD